MHVKRSPAWLLVLLTVSGWGIRPVDSFSSLPPSQRPSTSTTTILSLSDDDSPEINNTPLIDLQTFLKVTKSVQSGGDAKSVIQGGICVLNGEIETRRAKKLYTGDVVTFNQKTMDVSKEVQSYGYIYKPKKKKIKPVAKVVDAAGTLEFGGRYRSEEWRQERKERKTMRKNINKNALKETEERFLLDH